MARTRRSIAGRFLKRFEEDKASYDLAAQQATTLIKDILINSPALIHLVTARRKEFCKRPVEAVSTECQWAETMALVDTIKVSTKVSRGHFGTSEG